MTDDGSIDIFDGFIDDLFHQNHIGKRGFCGAVSGFQRGILRVFGMATLEYPHGKQMVNPSQSSWCIIMEPESSILKAFECWVDGFDPHIWAWIASWYIMVLIL